MKRLKNNLDEMQEQKLLKIEHNGCWLVFWGLLIAMVVQILGFGYDFRVIAGEWILFMLLSVYLCIACVRAGIWDRRIPMTRKSNLLASLIAALAVGLFSFAFAMRNFNKPVGSLVGSGIAAVFTFVLCFLVLSFASRWTKKRQQALETEPEDDSSEA